MRNTLILALCATCIVITSAVPIPSDNKGLEVVQIPLQGNKVSDFILFNIFFSFICYFCFVSLLLLLYLYALATPPSECLPFMLNISNENQYHARLIRSVCRTVFLVLHSLYY